MDQEGGTQVPRQVQAEPEEFELGYEGSPEHADEVELAPSDAGAPRTRPPRPWETELVEEVVRRDGGVAVPGDGTVVETVVRPRRPRGGMETIQYLADQAEDLAILKKAATYFAKNQK